MSCSAFANGINISSSRTNLNALELPVVFNISDQTGIDFKSVAYDLEQTGQFKTYFGSCLKKTSELHRQVACVTPSSYNVEISVPSLNGTRKTNIPINNSDSLNFADAIYKSALNTNNSPFLVKIAYVSKNPHTGVYKLAVANYNGSNARVLLTSPQPILSPSWSTDGRFLTYTSYETVRGSIFLHDINTNRRSKVFEQRGLNAYPSFGLSDSDLLLSASGENEQSHIFKLNILSKRLVKSKSTDKKLNAIYPRKLPDGTFIFVTLGDHDTPYLMHRKKDGKSVYVKHFPLNAPSTDRSGNIVAINGDKLMKFMHTSNERWSKGKLLAKDKTIESPSISNNGTSVFYIFEKKGKNFIANDLISAKKIITISSSSENLIQVSAF